MKSRLVARPAPHSSLIEVASNAITAPAIQTGGLPRRTRVVVGAPRVGDLDCRHLRQAPTDALGLSPPGMRGPLWRLFGGRPLLGNPEEPRRFPRREIPLLVVPPQIGHRIRPQRLVGAHRKPHNRN